MILLLCTLIFLILLSAFFSSAETGMMAVNRYRMQHLAKTDNRSAILVLKLLDQPDRLLSVILIGNTFANILASALATIIAVHYFGEPGAIVATIALTFIVLIFAEVAPKTMASSYADRYARIISRPLQVLLFILGPLVGIVNASSGFLLKMFKAKVKRESVQPLSRDELRSVVHSSSKNMPEKDKDMLLGIFDLKKVTAADIMVPRDEIVGIDLTNDIDTIITQIKLAQHTRIPLFETNLDHIHGILHLRKALILLHEPEFTRTKLKQAAKRAYFIPETVSLTQQLLRFQKKKERIAFVVDEYGEVQGLTTIDDILEEIVGEFTTDESDTSKDVQAQKDGSYLVDGSITIRELNRELKLDLPTDGPRTLNGLVIEHLEAIPKAGMSVKLHDLPVEVIHVKHNRIKTARLQLS